jgi:hypothetical protein
MCCTACHCLGFCEKSNPRRFHVSRSHDDIARSAAAGCCYCDLVLQSYKLFKHADSKPRIEILVSNDRPAEMSSYGVDGVREVIEIFGCPGPDNAVLPTGRSQAELSMADAMQDIPQLGRDVPSNPSSAASFSFLKNCYETCLQNHEKCQKQSSVLPGRLLDISSTPFRLVNLDFGKRMPYAALSYRWGDRESMATISTFAKLKNGIDPASIPTVFQEAARVCKEFGIHFVWIDSVCIILDDREDWATEVAKMASIYENANVVMAASTAANPAVSFISPRPSTPKTMPLSFKRVVGTFTARIQLDCGLHSDSSSSPQKDLLDNRGWALQEREMATRWVGFSTFEVQWKCRTMEACECLTFAWSPRSYFPDINQNVEESFQKWHRIVREYTSRTLTLQNDIFPALIGLAKKFNSITKATYVAGMWRENLIEDMVWKREESITFTRAPSEYLAPTFSWASTTGAITYHLGRAQRRGIRKYHSTVRDLQIVVPGSDMYSRVQEGWVVLHGPAINAQLSAFRPEAAHGYQLTVGGKKYCSDVTFFDDQADTGCEFTIDSQLTTLQCTDTMTSSDQTVTVVNRLRDTDQAQKSFDAVPVKLLSLYSLTQSAEANVYENFLILAQSRAHASKYERIGIGTGKIYLPQGEIYSPELDLPFAWISSDMGFEGAKQEACLEEDFWIV